MIYLTKAILTLLREPSHTQRLDSIEAGANLDADLSARAGRKVVCECWLQKI